MTTANNDTGGSKLAKLIERWEQMGKEKPTTCFHDFRFVEKFTYKCIKCGITRDLRRNK